MTSVPATRATIGELSRVQGKAELVGGRIVHFMPSGDLPSVIAGEIFASLRHYAKTTGRGVAYPDGVGYAVPELPSGRESFAPDASYFTGAHPANRMRFLEAAPSFAVEVRSENDYGPAAEEEMAAKRADYFAAGTAVVWVVDPLAQTVALYRASAPLESIIHRRGDMAHAEPALPGWRMPVNDIFGAS